MAGLQQLETDRARLGPLGPKPVSRGLPSVLRDELLEVELRRLVLLVGPSGVAIDGREFGPAVGQAHVYDAYRLEPRPRRFDAEQARGLTALDAAREPRCGRWSPTWALPRRSL